MTAGNPVIKIDGVAVYLDDIIRMTPRIRLDKGGTERVEIGALVYINDGGVLSTNMKISEIEDLMKRVNEGRGWKPDIDYDEA